MSGGANQPKRELYEFGPFRVDAEKELLLRSGEPVALTPRRFKFCLHWFVAAANWSPKTRS